MHPLPLAHPEPQGIVGVREFIPGGPSERYGGGLIRGGLVELGEGTIMEKWRGGQVPGSWQKQGAQKVVEIKPRLQISSGISPVWSSCSWLLLIS